jgi:prolyl-tRNA editing enzyme YbaK/EbsC (Cys-tRNA(Pro) deacylase)
VGHASHLRTFIDRDLLQFDRIWAAAGTPHAVFELTPAQLTNLAGAPVVEIQ